MKRKIFKILLYTLLGIILLITGSLIYIKLALPNVGPAPDIKVEGTVAQLERGEYLSNHVMVCMQCHSKRDFTLFAAPSIPGTSGMGGEIHDQRLGLPGKYVSTNLTPYELSDWTDGEIFRAITTGVNKEGKALFPIMPHHNFGKLDENDIKAVIAYLRKLQPIEFDTEPSYSDFPMNFIVNFIPQKASLKSAPPKTNKIEYGKYLVTAGSCYDCHTIQKEGKVIGPDFGGGFEFTLEDGSVVRSANLTPHPTGIGNWSAQQFVQRFKMYADSNYRPVKVNPGDFQTVMPWNTYAGMTEDDLLAIYEYLSTIALADNYVNRFTSSK
ncbi:MAG: c-type cytochrome [Bacteroidales bacterium]